jgi:hypothetical protein
MHVLGARFGTTHEALTALRELRVRYAIGEHDAEVRPLGSTQYDAPTSDLILAARFKPELVPEVVAMLQRLGGRVVVEQAEWPGYSAPSEPEAGASASGDRGEEDPGRPGPGRRIRDRVEAMGSSPDGRDRMLYPRHDWRRSSPRNLRRT